MSIHFITGNPGGGKGLLAMQKIVDELVHDERSVITNLPVRIEPWVRVWRRFGRTHYQPEIGLRMYLLQQHGRDFNVGKRVFYLEDEKVPEFYLHRRNCTGMVTAGATRDKEGRVEEFETETAVKNGGVCYVTDECWKFWNARTWQKTGPGLLFYSAQHRHLGDTWYIVTQKTAQVDKALHRVAQDFSVVTNQSKLPLGSFRRPDLFTVCIYDQAPTGAQLEPIKREVFKLDKKGLGACYDTAAGTGIGGGSGADIQERKKGLPWWLLPVGIIAMGFLVYKACGGAGRLVGWTLSGGRHKTAAVQTEAAAPAESVTVPVVAPLTVGVQVSTNQSTVEMLGYFIDPGGRDAEVLLSDGRTVRYASGLQYLSEHYCVVSGQVIRARKAGTRPAVSITPGAAAPVGNWTQLERKREVRIKFNESSGSR